MRVKDQILGDVFGGTPFDSISHLIHFVRTSCNQLPERYAIFCLLVEVVYWPSGLKFMYPTINLAFLWIIIKLNFQWKFACTVLKNWCKIVFFSCSRHCDPELVIVIVYSFQIWNKKKNTILLVIELRAVTFFMYIETFSVVRRNSEIY